MAKLKDDPITAADLEQFVRNDSDFAFEMKALCRLRELGFQCPHSGTYQDPITGKIRQYDIRAVRREDRRTLVLAAECKNIRPNRPLLLSAVPRTDAEAFHNLVIHKQWVTFPLSIEGRLGHQSAYRSGEFVAKKVDQVGRDMNEILLSDDEATFEKMNQAINSCKDLILNPPFNGLPPEPRVSQAKAIVPTLIVPDGCLWQVDYSSDGTLQVSPRILSRSSLYLQHMWSVPYVFGGTLDYCISHVEFVSLEGLEEAVKYWFSSDDFFSALS